jgi:threonine/homoserine/homoserine lactone efflux protein
MQTRASGKIVIEGTRRETRRSIGQTVMALPFDGRFAAWIAVALVLIVTPGPDTALIIRNALRSGARAASLSAVGVGLGSAVWATASVVGVAALLESSDLAFTAFKLAGAAYLIYLGLRSLAGTFRAKAAVSTKQPRQHHPARTPGPPCRRACSTIC